MPDIRIVPANAIMSFTSSLNYIERITQDPSGSLTLFGSGSTGRTELFSIDGNNGRLFSVSDDLSDSLFSVNTIAGLPVIEAFANNTVVLGQYGQNVLVVTGSRVGIGKATPNTTLDVTGSVLISGSLVVSASNNTLNDILTDRGTKSAPAYSFIGDTDTGLYSDAANQVGLTAGTRTGINVTDTAVFLDTNSTTAYTHVVMSNGSGLALISQVPTSSISLQGTTGAQGAQGVQGRQGTTGTNGSQGTAGTNGSQGTTGATGGTGAQGTTGTTGAQGTTGATGGTGATGAQGTAGTNGAQGTAGTNGAQGAQGIQGRQGTTGTGTQGTAGTNGSQGTSGTNGAQGTQGVQGPGGTGISGTTNYIPKFTSGTAIGNSVMYESGGSIGVGTTSPSAKLHVAGGEILDDGAGRITLALAGGQNEIYSTTTGFAAYNNLRISADATIFTNNSTERMRITNGGYVGIGTTGPSYPLHVAIDNAGTSIYASADIVAYSDQSVKENIRPIENVIERIQKSRGVLYDRTDIQSKNNIGFIAQELEAAFPELVITNEDGTKAVKYQNTVAVLFEAIKEQQKQIDQLKQIVNGRTK